MKLKLPSEKSKHDRFDEISEGLKAEIEQGTRTKRGKMELKPAGQLLDMI